ncbi:MAG TPA: crosslink repair DNA glycosylase YcaQ family protein [Solirubrobacteraceae bacterium]|nr:crosslink repair DNA glycosylase YcaQ family protein [Solirubrobacteraceae bacterium]
MQVSREQALAFRLAAHHLDERLPAGSDDEAAAVIGLQDFPPGLAPVALAARVEHADTDRLVIVYAWRGAAVAVPRADVAVFTLGLAPPDDDAARTLIGTAVETLDPEGISATDALDRVSAAVADALADGPLERDDFHQALRERLPGELLRWCRGCQSHHVHPSLWRATGIRGVLAVTERRGRVTVFGAPPRGRKVKDAPAELARRFLHAYGPATRSELAAWAGIAPAHARALLDAVAGELEEVDFDGRPALILAADADRLADPPAASGVRLLGPFDPYLDQRDRETLFPDRELRARARSGIGAPGAVLVDGALAGLWRPAKKGKRLVITVEPVTKAARKAADAIAAEAEIVAPHRGCDRAEVVFG